MKALTVNDALGRKDQIHGHCIEIEGLLTYQSGIVCLAHWPKSEQTPGSVIGIDTEGAFAFNDDVMQRWSGKRVVVLGVFQATAPELYEGWYNVWEAFMVARRIDLLKKRLIDHDLRK